MLIALFLHFILSITLCILSLSPKIVQFNVFVCHQFCFLQFLLLHKLDIFAFVWKQLETEITKLTRTSFCKASNIMWQGIIFRIVYVGRKSAKNRREYWNSALVFSNRYIFITNERIIFGLIHLNLFLTLTLNSNISGKKKGNCFVFRLQNDP